MQPFVLIQVLVLALFAVSGSAHPSLEHVPELAPGCSEEALTAVSTQASRLRTAGRLEAADRMLASPEEHCVALPYYILAERGRLFHARGQTKAAIATMRSAMKIAPGALAVRHELASLLLNERRPQEALDIVRTGLSQSKSPSLQYHLLHSDIVFETAGAKAAYRLVARLPETQHRVPQVANRLRHLARLSGDYEYALQLPQPPSGTLAYVRWKKDRAAAYIRLEKPTRAAQEIRAGLDVLNAATRFPHRPASRLRAMLQELQRSQGGP